MTERPICPKCKNPMTPRRYAANTADWVCGKCATDLLFHGRGENYVAKDILEGRTHGNETHAPDPS